MKDNTKICYFHVRLTAPERAMLEALAKQAGVNISEAARMSIRQAARQQQPVAPFGA